MFLFLKHIVEVFYALLLWIGTDKEKQEKSEKVYKKSLFFSVLSIY